MKRMFDLWLRKYPEAAWEDVVSALRKMDENRLAKTIEKKYCEATAGANNYHSYNNLIYSTDEQQKGSFTRRRNMSSQCQICSYLVVIVTIVTVVLAVIWQYY